MKNQPISEVTRAPSPVPWGGGSPVPLNSPVPMSLPTQPPTTDPLLGLQVGSYKILKLLGTGGMGSVYLGEHAGIGSRVAIKFLHEHLASNSDLVQRFYAEARSVNVIGHANIVSIFDMNVLPPNRYYLVMEYLEGRSLESIVAQGPMPMGAAVHVLVQVCDALDQAHEAGVVHRDLKPENLILVKRGRQDDFVKILDFGIAKLQSTMASRKTATGIIIGTPDYMAPEQAQGDNVDSRTDQYSLGVIAYELATGKTPFAGLPLTSMLVAHLSQEPKPPHELNPTVSKSLSDVIMKALAKKPDARFKTCGDFGRALEEALLSAQTSPSALQGIPVSSAEQSGSRAAPATPAPPPEPVAFKHTPIEPVRTPAGSGIPSTGLTPPPGSANRSGGSGLNAAYSPGNASGGSGLNQAFVPGSSGSSGSNARGGVTPSPSSGSSPTNNRAGSGSGLNPAAAATPRHLARFDVKVKGEGPEQTLICQDVSRAGCFVVSSLPPPRVFSRVTVTIPDVGPMQADVVRHVTKEQSEAWNMPQGFGLQFVSPRPEQREALDLITRGLPVASAVPPTVTSHTDDPVAEKVLAELRKRIQGDHYVVLSLPFEVDFPAVKARGRELTNQLVELGRRPISLGQRKQIDAALERVKAAVDVLGNPGRRAEFDGMRFNWKGVGVSLSGGLRVTELEEIRKRFLKANDGTEARSALHLITANSHERDGNVADALRVVEHALGIDPLNLELHHRRKALLRKTPAKK